MATENTYKTEEEKKRNNKGIILLLSILVLLAIGFIIFQQIKISDLTVHQKDMDTKLINSDNLRKELEKDTADYNSQVSVYKGKVSSLDSTISVKDKNLLELKRQAEALLKESKISYNKFLEAQDAVDKYKYYAEKYQKEIVEKDQQIKELTEQNSNLTADNNTKAREIDNLKDVNADLSNRVALGAQLHVDDMVVTGVKIRKGGKESETSRANRIDKIKICFNIPENHVAKDAQRDVYIRVLDPSGQTVSVEGVGGSGKFKYNGTEVLYTSKEEIYYDNTAKSYCLYWNKETELRQGKYVVELYTEGYKMGEKSIVIN